MEFFRIGTEVIAEKGSRCESCTISSPCFESEGPLPLGNREGDRSV